MYLVIAGTSKRYVLPWGMRASSGLSHNKAVYVTSNKDVKVEAITMDTYGNGAAYLVFPTQEGAMEFVSIGHWGHSSYYSAIYVVASEANTNIKIFRYGFKHVLRRNVDIFHCDLH